MGIKKAAIEREKSDACISFPEREQARGAASIKSLEFRVIGCADYEF